MTHINKYFYLLFILLFAFSAYVFWEHPTHTEPAAKKDLLPTPKVAVLMATYNRAGYLPMAIESILNQTFKDFEFIIINDGSADKTSEVLKSYAQKDKRIIVLENNTNKGLVYSLNRGLDLARGEYIARMDDDDLSFENRLAVQTKFLDSHPDITVLGSGFCKREDSQCGPGGPKNPEMAKIISYIRVPVMHPTTMIRRAFLNEHNIRYNKKYPSSEDTEFFHKIAVSGGKITNIDDPLLIYATQSKKFNGYKIQQAISHKNFVHDTLTPLMDMKNVKPDAKGMCAIFFHLEKAAQKNMIDIDLETIRSMLTKSKCEKYSEDFK